MARRSRCCVCFRPHNRSSLGKHHASKLQISIKPAICYNIPIKKRYLCTPAWEGGEKLKESVSNKSMSASIQSDSQKLKNGAPAQALAAARPGRGWLLIAQVFVAGACSLAVEVSASRLLAPAFGDTLFVWANLIGLILLYLTVGYYVGGRLADRYPRASLFYILTAVAALFIAIIPLLSRPILTWTQNAFASNPLGVFYGSLVSVI